VDQPDLWDVVLFVRQWLHHVTALLLERPAISYLPLSQSRIGFLRDSFFMIPAFFTNCAVVVHLHGANFEQVYQGGGTLFRRYVDWIFRRVRKFVVLGEMLRPIFGRWTTVADVAVVPNGVPEGGRTPIQRMTHATTSLPRIVFLSTLSRAKGLLVLLDALALVARECKEFECRIAGPWWGAGMEGEARTRLKDLALEPLVTFRGPLTGDEKMEFLKTGDIFVFPGVQQEGQPLTVLEAMCAGLPVVATDRGCMRETVVEGVTGYVVPPNDPELLAERVLRLLQDHELRRRLSAAARRRYECEYTMPIFAARMADLFARLCDSDYHGSPTATRSHHWSTER